MFTSLPSGLGSIIEDLDVMSQLFNKETILIRSLRVGKTNAIVKFFILPTFQ